MRILDRLVPDFIKKRYAAGKMGPGGWVPVEEDFNDIIKNSSPIVRAKVRNLVRDFPYFGKASKVLVNYVVGKGFKYQSKLKDPKANQILEDTYKFVSDEIDIAGKNDVDSFARLMRSGENESGESFFVMRSDDDPSRYTPFCLQHIEPERVSDPYTGIKNSNNDVYMGVEYNKSTGKPVAYHIESNGYNTNHTRVPAKYVIHTFEQLRPGQLRGISPFTAAVNLSIDLKDLLGANLDRAKLASKWLAFVTSDGFRRTHVNPDNQQKRIKKLQNGIIKYLKPGEKIEVNESNHPGNNFEPFVRLLLMMISVTCDVPYELLSGDYRGLNYSVSRGVRNDFKKDLEPKWSRTTKEFHKPIFHMGVEFAYLKGRHDLPGFSLNPFSFTRQGLWVPPPLPPVDPLKDAKADAQLIKECLKSPFEVLAERGHDAEEVLNDIERWNKMKRDRGITLSDKKIISSATNPAALEKQEEKKSA